MNRTASANTLLVHKSEGARDVIRLDYVMVKNAAMTLRALNHKLRQQIIKLLKENTRMNVTDIYVKLRLEQSVASQHLAILRRANIVTIERDAKYIYYALNYSRIAAIEKFVNTLVNSEDDEDLRYMPISTSSKVGQPSFHPVVTNEELEKAKSEITELTYLEYNWDEEDGFPIDKHQIRKSLLFIEQQYNLNNSIPYFIAPTVNSGVLIEYLNKSKRIDVRFEKSNPYMTIFDSGVLQYEGKVDQVQINKFIK